MKQRGQCILILLLGSLLFFIFGCQNVFEPPRVNENATGDGYLSLAINGVQTGRTILPTTVQNDFAIYTLEFFANKNPILDLA
jgi:hypothetical protein